MSHSEFNCVKAAPIFSQLSDNIITQLVNISVHQKSYPAGSYIYEPDDDLSALILVDSGQVDIFNINDSGQELLLYSLHAHQMDIEAALFTDTRHHHFARAKVDSQICMIRRADFQKLLQQNTSLAIQILNTYGERLTTLEQRQISLSLQNADERLLQYFQDMAAAKQTKTFQLTVTKKELAASLQIAPETLSRLLKKLTRNGIIALNKREVTLL